VSKQGESMGERLHLCIGPGDETLLSQHIVAMEKEQR